MKTKILFGAALCVAAMGVCVPSQARAEVDEVRIAKQYGIGYLPLAIMEHDKLVEKHASAAGIEGLKVTWSSFAGANVMNDALLSNSLDFAAVGTTSLPLMWAKTSGTKQEIKGVCAIVASPLYLNTRNPDVKSISDLTDKDRIALPAVKVSIQAMILQMAAAKEFGDDQVNKLDHLTISRSHPDAMMALLSGKGEINGHFTWAPFQYRELEDPAVHTILNSYDVLGGPATTVVMLGTKRFHDENPKLYQAFLGAVEEATNIINKDKRHAAQVYLDTTKDKDSVDNIVKMLSDPQVKYTTMPKNVSRYTEFMHRMNIIKKMPASWKDMFFPEVFSLTGTPTASIGQCCGFEGDALVSRKWNG